MVYSAELIETAGVVAYEIETAPADEWRTVRVVLLASRLYEALKAERRAQGCASDMRVMLDHAIARCRRAAAGPTHLFAREIVAIASVFRAPRRRRPMLRVIEGGLASPRHVPVVSGPPAN